MSGTHMVIAPVAGTPKIAIDPCPSWNTQHGERGHVGGL
jgi:hypothetical protein